MCGICEEEDSQETPQDPAFEQYVKDGIHPDQLELWDKFQKEYFALKKTRERASQNSQVVAADAPMANTVSERVEPPHMQNQHMRMFPDTLHSAAKTRCHSTS